MKKSKQRELERKGWKFGTVEDFLGLTADEVAFVELKLALTERLRSTRNEKGITQQALAEAIKSSQSRVAKMEAGDPSVSLDLLVKTLLALGETRRQIAHVIASDPAQAGQH